ncbi:MAG: hypothetical protein AAB676_12865 [Verrucomicrobiota bacterium]
MSLCDLGPRDENVAHLALREGAQARVQEVIMEEFHYDADGERCLESRLQPVRFHP